MPKQLLPSLLHPLAGATHTGGRPAPNEADLGLARIIRALDFDGRHSRFVGSVLAELCADPAVIGYRQDLLDNLLRLPDLVASIAVVLPQLGELGNISRASNWGGRISRSCKLQRGWPSSMATSHVSNGYGRR